jgi:hypothetical protein
LLITLDEITLYGYVAIRRDSHMDATPSYSSRRGFLRTVTAVAVGYSFVPSAKLLAETNCNAQGLCTSQVDFAEFAQEAFQTQQMPEWCWAACISMLFAFYDHPVSQERIVSEVYGSPVNMPAAYGINIAKQLNKTWTDDNGKKFRAILTGAYDFDAHVKSLNNVMLLEELDGDHPMIIGSAGHATVLTAMQYIQTPLGPNVVSCGVFDPWPGRGARNLTPVEMVPIERGGALRFAATARIKDLS